MSSNPYLPPSCVADAAPGRPEVRRRVRSSLVWLAVAIAVLGVAVGIAIVNPSPFGTIAFLMAAIAALVGAVRGAASLAHAVRSPRAGVGLVLAATLASVANLAMAGIGALGALLSTMTFSRGRQLRRFGRVLLAPLSPGDAWVEPCNAMDLDDDARAAVAARWRENARTEHASVAAFGRLTLDLVALGAQPELVAAAHRDALDEIAHAEICFGLARAIDGADVGPGAFAAAARTRALSREVGHPRARARSRGIRACPRRRRP